MIFLEFPYIYSPMFLCIHISNSIQNIWNDWKVVCINDALKPINSKRLITSNTPFSSTTTPTKKWQWIVDRRVDAMLLQTSVWFKNGPSCVLLIIPIWWFVHVNIRQCKHILIFNLPGYHEIAPTRRHYTICGNRWHWNCS